MDTLITYTVFSDGTIHAVATIGGVQVYDQWLNKAQQTLYNGGNQAILDVQISTIAQALVTPVQPPSVTTQLPPVDVNAAIVAQAAAEQLILNPVPSNPIPNGNTHLSS